MDKLRVLHILLKEGETVIRLGRSRLRFVLSGMDQAFFHEIGGGAASFCVASFFHPRCRRGRRKKNPPFNYHVLQTRTILL